jgi:quinol monooxygenase YgiN
VLIIAGEIGVAEGTIDSVKDALATMESETRKEAGCLAYAFSLDINDPTMMRVFERWESMGALEAHFKTPHMAAFGAAIGKIQPSSLDIKAYEIGGEVALPRS